MDDLRLQEDLNRIWWKQYPHITKSMSLSKIRRMKDEFLNTFFKEDGIITLYSLTVAWILFEKLILKNVTI